MAQRILFVTGRLAEFSLRRVLDALSRQAGFEYEVAVLGISVAALMHTEWVRRKLQVPPGIDRVILPGWCQGEIPRLSQELGVPLELGPKDLHDLPDYFGKSKKRSAGYGGWDIEILAEINHAPRLSDAEILRRAADFRSDGADVIDLGCVPGESWGRAGEVTRLLVQEGFRVSIDSFDRPEVEAAVAAGAELVLSCNGTNRDWAADLPAELVAIPDDPRDLATLDRTVEVLSARGARFRLDPVLEPIGFGFAASLGRYLEVRQKWPAAEMMMGVGNLTELTEVDTAGVNVLLAGFCQEQGIRSILTTEVINWGRSAVREFDLARRLVYHSVRQQVLPKHVDSRLVMLRDPKLREMGPEELQALAAQLKDPNYRVFVERGEIHLMNRDGYWHGTDPFELFDQLQGLDPAHAFYLGYELAKAVTALTLGKQYRQDEALQWGFLTLPEKSAHERRRQQ
jgi:dihydropteroate synthase-like protein